jgi:hypothetical protein
LSYSSKLLIGHFGCFVAQVFFIESTVWDGCTPRVAASIRRLTESWGPYSTKSRRYPLYGLFGEVIGPAWSAYIASLPARHVGRRQAAEFDLTTAARDLGFDGLRQGLEKIARAAYSQEGQCDIKKAPSFKSGRMATATIRPSRKTNNFVFTQTLESLIELADRCSAKGPRSTIAVDNVNALRGGVYCHFCGQETEVRSYLNADPAFREANWPHDHGTLVPSLSSKYCIGHRPRNHDGSWNPEYKRAKRAGEKFQLEARRLTHQSTSISIRLASSGNVAVDDFYLDVIKQKLLYPDEKTELRNHANQLVRHKVSDRKKFIVTLRTAGFTQKEISQRCGISQQAVSKALKSLPAVYRLDV